jgi:hypothetical protein
MPMTGIEHPFSSMLSSAPSGRRYQSHPPGTDGPPSIVSTCGPFVLEEGHIVAACVDNPTGDGPFVTGRCCSGFHHRATLPAAERSGTHEQARSRHGPGAPAYFPRGRLCSGSGWNRACCVCSRARLLSACSRGGLARCVAAGRCCVVRALSTPLRVRKAVPAPLSGRNPMYISVSGTTPPAVVHRYIHRVSSRRCREPSTPQDEK